MPTTDFEPFSRYRTICNLTIAALFVFAVVYGFKCVQHGRVAAVKRGDEAVSKKIGNDFTAFYSAGEQARLGRNIYEWESTSVPHRPFEYPPLFAIFPMMLLSYLPYNTALAVFYALNVFLLAMSFWMLKKLFWPSVTKLSESPPLRLLPLPGMLLTLGLTWRFIHTNTNESNANLYMLFLLTLAFYCTQYRTTKPWNNGVTGWVASGLAVALATTIKLTPGLFGLYFLWTRRIWGMLGGAIGLILFLIVIPAAFLGWKTNLEYFEAYRAFALGKTVGADTSERPGPNRIVIGRARQLDPNESSSAQGVGVSIRGILISLLTPSPALKANGNNKRTVNIATIDLKHVGTIANIVSLVILLATIALTARDHARSDNAGAALSWSLVTVAMTLISPLTRIAHLVVLIFPIATLVSMLQWRRLGRAAAFLTVAAFVLLMVSTMTPEYFHAIGFTTFSLFVLYAALASALWKYSVSTVPALTQTHPDRAPNTAAAP